MRRRCPKCGLLAAVGRIDDKGCREIAGRWWCEACQFMWDEETDERELRYVTYSCQGSRATADVPRGCMLVLGSLG